MQGRIDKLTNSMQAMWVNAMDSDILKGFISFADVIVQATDKVGLFNVAIAALMAKIAFSGKHFGIVNLLSKISGGAIAASGSINILGMSLTAGKTAFKLFNAAATMGVSLLVGLVIAGIGKLINAEKEAKAAADEAAKASQNLKQQADSLDDYKKQITELRTSLDSNNLSESEAYDARKKLLSIQDELIDKFGLEKDGINLVTGAINDQIATIDELSRKNAQQWLNNNQKSINDAIDYFNDPDGGSSLDALGTTTSITNWGSTKNVTNMVEEYANNRKNMTTGRVGIKGQYIDFKGSIEEVKTEVEDFQAWLADKEDETQTQLTNLTSLPQNEQTNDVKEQIKSLENDLKQIKDLREDMGKEATNWFGEDSTYASNKALMNEIKQQTALAKYADEYYKIIEAQNAFKEAQAKGDQEGMKKALSDLDSATKNAMDTASEDYMGEFFSELGDEFKVQEFELNVKLNEDGLKTKLQDIIAEGGENGLSALDDNAIKDMVSRDLNAEGATDASGKYTEEQISGLIALQAEADNAGISIENLIKILTNLGLIAGRPAEAVTEGIRAVGQVYSTLAAEAEKYKDINKVLNELAYDNIEISEEQYDALKELIGSEEEFADCIDTSNGYIVKNIALTKKLVDQKKKEQAADVKLAKSQARLEYYKLVKQLNNTLNGTKKLDSATRESISTTLSQIDAVEQAIYKYQLLEDSLLGATNAFDEFAKAQEIDALNTYGDSYVEMVQTMYDALYKTGQVGTEQFQAALKALVPDSVYQGLSEEVDRMQAIFDYFNDSIVPTLTLEDDSFTLDYSSIENFVNKAIEAKVLLGDVKSFDLAEGMNLEKAAELMGMTVTQAYAFFAELDKYNTGSEQSFLSQLDDSLEGRINNITTELEDLNRQKLALLEDDGYDANKAKIDEINQKVASANKNLSKLGEEAYNTWQEYTKNDAALAALDSIEDKQRKLTQKEANTLGIEWDEKKALTVQEAYDQLLAKQLQLEEPTVLTAQLAIDNIDAQIATLKDKLAQAENDPTVLGVKANADQTTIDAAKQKIQDQIQALEEDKVVISTEFGIELSEEDKKTLQEELDNIEEFSIHDKKFKVILNGASAVMATLESINALAGDVNKTVTTTYTTVGSGRNEGVHPSGSGGRYTKYANGTAHAQGNWGAPKTETALVGELGREIIVDPKTSKWRTVGDNGAEFTTVPRGSIVFNHKQTEELLKNGYITSRGKLQGGSALASGTAYAGLWQPTNGSGSGKGSGSSSADDAKDQFEEIFDWIEVRLEEINKQLDFKNARLENSVGYSKQNTVINQMLDLNEKLYDNLIAGANKYYEYAGQLLAKIPAEYRQAAQDGSIAIETFVGEVDEETYNAIQDFREWVQKGDDAIQQAEEVITEVSSLAKQAIDNIATDFGNKNSLRDNKIDQLDAYNALTEAKYGAESETIYKAIIKETNKNIKTLETQRDKMQAELDKQVKEGNIQKYSQDWYDAVNDIAAVDTEIINLTKDTYDYQDAINDLHWDAFDNIISRFKAISDEADNLIDILGEKDLVNKDTAEWTNEGVTALGLYAQKMEVAEMQAKKYEDEINYLNKNWKKLGYTEQEYVEKLEELKEGQYDAIKAYNDTKKAIVDLNKERVEAIKNGIQKEIDAYEKLINKKKEELDADKDAHDWQKTVADKQKNIADIERKIAALSADDSASARAQRAKLQAELLEAQADLQEAYYDRSITDQQNALDKELENFKESKDKEIEGWDEYLENTEQVVADSLSTVQTNTDIVYQTLKAMGKEYSLSIAESLTSPWKDGENAIQSFSEKFGLSMSSTVEELQKLADEYKKVMDQIANAGNEAIEQADDNASRYQQANNPDKPKFEQPENVVKPVTPSGGGSAPSTQPSQPSHAGAVSGISAWLKQGSQGADVRTLQQALNDLGFNAGAVDGIFGYNTKQAVMRFQSSSKYGGAISADGIVGPDTKRKFKTAGYAKGTAGVKKNQLAVIDELGEELQLVPDGNGRLAYLKKGTAIIPHDISENLMQLGQLNPQDILDRNRPTISAPHITNNETVINIEYGDVLHIENFNGDKPEDLSKMIDKAFDKHMKDLNQQIRRYVR
jgi:peptidoglycan hydrolase-like protein with peptidoglycan-binding domain